MAVLTITGSTITPAIYGAAAGSGSIDYGWPDASLSYLDALKQQNLNYSHTRSGPFIRASNPAIVSAGVQARAYSAAEARVFKTYSRIFSSDDAAFEGYVLDPDGRYDLTKFNPLYDKKERDFLAEAQKRGIYVERVILDDWPAKYCLWPYCAGKNKQGVDYTASVFKLHTPPPEMEAWVRHRVANACHSPVWFPALDNEPRPVNTSAEWTRYLYFAVKDEMQKQGCPDRPIGSGNTDAWDTVDYQILHTFRAPAPSLKPVLVNETDNRDTTPDQYVLRAYRGREVGGVYFMYWPGPMEDQADKVQATLDLYGTFVKTPTAPDYGCPLFTGIKVNIQAVQGDKYTMNSSPRPFSEGADPFSSLGSGLCEDVWINSRTPLRFQDGYGPDWTITGGGTVEPNWSNVYLAFVQSPVAGSTQVKACSRADTNCGVFTFP